MLADVGVKFSMQGTEDVASRLSALENQWKNFSSAFDKQAQMERHFHSMARSAQTAAHSIQRSMNLAKLAIAGVLTGKAAAGIANWMGGSSDVGHEEDFLRSMGAGEDRINAFREVAKKLGRNIAGIDRGDFMKGMYDVQSLHADEGMQQMTRVGETMGFLSKKLRSSVTEAADFYKVMYEGFGRTLPEAQRKGFHGDVLAGVTGLLAKTGIKPEELKMAMRQLGPVYAMEGKTWIDALTDMAMVIPTMGAERGGTALRNIAGRKTEMFAKLEEEVQKIRYEQMYGQKFRDMSEEAQALFMKGKGWTKEWAAEQGALLERSNPGAFWAQMNQKMELIKRAGGDWMGKLRDALGEETFAAISKLAEAWKSGYRTRTGTELQGGLDPEASKAGILESQKSFATQYKIFQQKILELSGKARLFMAPGFTELFQGWGTSVEGLSSSLDAAMVGSTEKFRAAIKSFKASFATAFGSQDLGFEQKLKDMITWLGQGEEGWKRIGEAIGQITGDNLKAILDTLKNISQAAGQISDLLSWFGFKGGAPTALSPAKQRAYAAEHTPFVGESKLKKRGLTRELEGKQYTLENPPSVWEAFGFAAKAAKDWAVEKLSPTLPGWAQSPVQVIPPGHASDRVGSQAASQPVQANIENRYTVTLDGKTIAEEVAPLVSEIIDGDSGRKRFNSMDAWGMAP